MGTAKIKDQISIDIDTNGLTPGQIRLIRSVNTLLLHVIKTDDESEFFDGSAEFMRMCASLIKQSYFANELKDLDGISYAEQALEYSMDVLQECMQDAKVVQYDN